ncbi:MAG: HAMP domain-containing sensor histidine kinase [Campylobacterota bacterium]
MSIPNKTALQNKVSLLKNIIMMIGVIVVVMTVMRVYQANYLQVLNNLALIAVLAFSYVKLNDTDEKRFLFVARLVFLSAFGTLFVLMLYSEERVTQFIWFGTTFYLLFYLLEKGEGWRWFIAFLTILITLYVYDSTLLGLSIKDFLTWIFNMFVIVIIASRYEEIKEESTQRLLNVQYILADEVKAKTFELQELNTGLEQRVKEETEKNRYQEQMMMQQTRMAQMGEMISMIAHQWRQPLAAISATTNALILKNASGKHEVDLFDDRLHKIAGYSQHLSMTIDDFRNFFKKDKETKETTFEAIIEDVLGIIQVSLENKNIKVITDFTYNKRVKVYAGELKQVILNLVKNSEDALLENKVKDAVISLSTFMENGEAVLRVEDNGGGIDEAIIGEIFDPYFSTKEAKDGTGLGLYMSKIIVEEHCGGTMSVENGSSGAVFTITMQNKEV